MIKIISIIIIILLSFGISSSDIFLVAEPLEDVNFYIISIDGNEFTINSSFDMIFFYGLSNLDDGKYTFKIIPVSEDGEEGGSVQFFLTKKTTRKHIEYSIKKDKQQIIKDPYYNDRFDEPLKIRINKKRIKKRDKMKFLKVTLHDLK